MGALPVDTLAIVASLCTAVLFGAEAICSKRGIEAGGTPLLASLVVAIVSIVLYWAVVFATIEPSSILTRSSFGIAIFLLSGTIGSGLGLIVIYEGIDRVGASITSAITQGRPLFAAVFGFIVLSESLRATTVTGIVVLVLGLVLISVSKGGDVRGWRRIELTFPLAAAIAFAVGNVVRRYGLTRTDVPLLEGVGINAVGGLVVLVAYVALTRGRGVFAATRRSYGWFLLTGLAAAGGLFAMFFALERERVAIVDSIVATSPLITLLLAGVFLRNLERITLRVVLGAVLVVFGAILIVGM